MRWVVGVEWWRDMGGGREVGFVGGDHFEL